MGDFGSDVPRSKDWSWYHSSIGNKLTPECRELFESYARIPADKVESHIYKIVRLHLNLLASTTYYEFMYYGWGVEGDMQD